MISLDIPAAGGGNLPSYRIFSNGTELGTDFVIQSMMISRKVNKVPTARLVLTDGSIPNEEFETSSGPDLAPGAEIEIQMGYRGEDETVFKGIIVKQGIKSQSQSASILTIEMKDEAFKMTIGRKSKYFNDVTDSDVMGEVIDDNGLDKDVETTTVTHGEMVQFHCTNWDFLLARAEANGKLIFVDDGKVTVAAPAFAEAPSLNLLFGQNILEFDVEMDARQQFSSVITKAWDLAEQAIVESTSNEPSFSEQGNISTDDLSAIAGLEELPLQHSGRFQNEELESWANARLMRSRLSKIKGRLRIYGDPVIKPGATVELAGLGDRFNGQAYVTGVNQVFGGGSTWYTDILIGLKADWGIQAYDDVMDEPAAALLPAVSGLQIGVVTALADDPEQEQRVRVRLPIIDEGEEGVWARIGCLDAGENRGTFFRPEVDNEVIVGFINDDPRDPIILGMLHSSKNPAPFEPTEDNFEKGFVSREELKLIFNDDVKSVTIETPNGNTCILSDDEGGIMLKDENGNSVILNSDGISLDSAKDIILKASGDIKMEGTNIESSANANFKAEGSAGLEVSSSATTTVKGSLVQIN